MFNAQGRYGTRSTSALTMNTSGNMPFFEKYLDADLLKTQTISFQIRQEKMTLCLSRMLKLNKPVTHIGKSTLQYLYLQQNSCVHPVFVVPFSLLRPYSEHVNKPLS